MKVYAFGPFRLDEEQLLLSLGSEPMALGPKVVETLLVLVKNPGVLHTKAELLDAVWPEGFVEEANLAQNVYVIRKTLRAHWDAETIATVPRRGYRFVAPVRVLDTEAAVSIVPEPVRRPGLRARMSLAFTGLAACAALVLGFANAARPHGTPAVTAHRPALSDQGQRMYAIGRYYWNQRTSEGVQKSLRYFSNVTRSDPHDARGYAAVAQAYAILGDYGYSSLKPDAAYQRAREYARKALALDPFSAEAHAAMGIAQDRPGRRNGAQAEYRKAVALDPQYAPAHQWYGISLLMQGKSEAAYSELKRAAELEPLSVAATAWLADAAYFSRRYAESVEYAHQTLDLFPQRKEVLQILGLSYEALGKYKDALAAYDQYAQSCDKCRLEVAPLIAHTDAVAGRFDEARAQLRVARGAMASKIVAPEDVGVALVALGQREDALRILQRVTPKMQYYPSIAMDPRMDPVRNDKRFRAFTQGPA
jgi:DNA-binding winged helix-turn-helix (wHTH) protein/tetratricopeptide (TPR) repeat protein